jgi:hypothetical protein
VLIQRGDEALAGQKEKDILGHRFPLNLNNDRTIYFTSKYILIVNKETDDQKTFEENVVTYTDFKVPASYTCYVRGASVYFKV